MRAPSSSMRSSAFSRSSSSRSSLRGLGRKQQYSVSNFSSSVTADIISHMGMGRLGLLEWASGTHSFSCASDLTLPRHDASHHDHECEVLSGVYDGVDGVLQQRRQREKRNVARKDGLASWN